MSASGAKDDDRVPTSTETALAETQRAVDNAIRTMFELAYRLEFLREAIERANTEPPRARE